MSDRKRRRIGETPPLTPTPPSPAPLLATMSPSGFPPHSPNLSTASMSPRLSSHAMPGYQTGAVPSNEAIEGVTRALSTISSSAGSTERPHHHSSNSNPLLHASSPLSQQPALPITVGSFINLEGYRDVQIKSLHYNDTVVCRAISIARGDISVWIKLSLSARSEAAAHFKAEAALLEEIHETGVHNVSRVLAREVGRLGAMMIIQDEGLRQLWEVYLPPERSPAPHWLDPSHFLQALSHSIQLIRLLSSVHDLSIVHGALRPATISVDIFSEVHLHDFSTAFRVGPDNESSAFLIRERGMSEDSLPYLAPECTGRVGRTADYRADYYSVGALLYEVFTGRTPFEPSSDLSELVHSHIARRPPLASTIDPSIPLPLAQVLAKLLEKPPEERYQTSRGLILDLEKISDVVRAQIARKQTPGLQMSAVDPVSGFDEMNFAIGAIDSAAHFRLPEATKLYGRQDAVEKLLGSFERVRKGLKEEVVVVMGSSGIGKTSLVETLRRPVVESSGYYTSVKFDQIKSPVPFFAITQALSGLLRQLLSESAPQLVIWRSRLSAALGKEGRILADVLPTLENVFEAGWADTLPAVVLLGPAESEERFQGVVRRVLRTFAKAGAPLVVVFDDLQWTTLSDIDFILSLISKDDASPSSSLLLLCAFRDNEVSSDHIIHTHLLPRLEEVHEQIKLNPLALGDVMDYIEDSLRRPNGKAERTDPNVRGLAELILKRTAGSPLFVAQLLKALNAEGLFTFDFALQRWHFDLELIASTSVSADVVELLQAQIRKFSPATQEALKVAACIGNEDLSSVTLSKAVGRSLKEIAEDLEEAVELGLLLPSWAGRKMSDAGIRMDDGAPDRDSGLRNDKLVPSGYRFFHDRCQQAAYGLVAPEERNLMHYQIGRRLVAAFSSDAIQDNIFDLANQLNFGVKILATSQERDDLARYNFLAGEKANKSTAFEAARKYLSIALELLGPGGWKDRYSLTSQVTEAMVDVEYSLADYAAAQEYVRVYLNHSRDLVAKLRIYSRSIRCATATGDSIRALEIGRQGLSMVGHDMPNEAVAAEAMANAIRAELNLNTTSIEGLRDLPRLTDPIASGALAIMSALVAPLYFTRIDLLGALAAHAVRTTVRYGIDDAGAFMLTLHAVLVAGYFQQHAESYAFGQVAKSYFERYGGSPLAAAAFKVIASHINVWSIPIRSTLPTFHQSVAYGIEWRDAEYLGFASAELCAYSLLAGLPLPALARSLERFSILVRKFRNELSTLYISVVHQMVLTLVGRSADTIELEGEAFSVDDYQVAKDKGYAVTLHLYHAFRLMLAVFYHDKEKARESVKIGRAWIHGGQGILYPAFFQLFEAVSLFDNFETITDEERATLAASFKYFDALAIHQRSNFGHMRTWLAAEEARSRKDWSEAVTLYDRAIADATEAEFIHLAACMNERCAMMLTAPKLAAGYLLEALASWKVWGCTPKVNSLIQQWPLIFPSLLPGLPPSVSTSGRSRLPSVPVSAFSAAPEPSNDGSVCRDDSLINGGLERRVTRSSSGSRGSANGLDATKDRRNSAQTEFKQRSQLATELDLRTVVAASSVISSETSVDGAVAKLLALALRTAGAELCLLVLEKGGILCAEAVATSNSSEVKHLRRVDAIDVQPDRYPTTVIHYVARSRAMVLNNLGIGGEALADPYLRLQRPKSILCLPLASQRNLIGVLYMENSQTTNAFTSSRLEILSLISGQAASTIEKARLVQDLKLANEGLKRSQTSLEDYNVKLEATVAARTTELIEKNDRLVAEVVEKELAQAEMRRAKDIAESATQTKSAFLATMSHEIRTPFNAVVALSTMLLDTELSPLQTDYVETIKNSSHELLVVINDILDFSKIELDHLELTKDRISLRSAIESSLDMVAERSAAKSIELALVLEQGDIEIVTDLTRLRQILINLLSNAVKFTSNGEIVVTASSELVDSPPGENLCRVRVSVRDTGIGIHERDFSKLFLVYSQLEGAETTKQFGGTGLGLAISRKLSNLMNGDITVESKVGSGSTFTLDFTVPCAAPVDLEKDVYSPNQNLDLAGKRVLIVDNNKVSRGVLQQLVTSFGLQATAPEDPSLAWQQAVDAHQAGQSYDVIVIDAFLPGFGAQTLLRRLRSNGIDSPAIALTRMGSPIHEEMRALDCKFLIKPIKRNRLHYTLRQVFPSPEPRRTSITDLSISNGFPSLGISQPLVILAAEDNPINVKVITHLLRKLGYSSDVAEDGLIALEKVQKKTYDLIFMDVNMPNMNGLECTRKLVEMYPDKTKRPLIVAMTANALSFHKQACLDAGCDGYVSKPILVPALMVALNDANIKAQRDRYSLLPLATPSISSGELNNPFFVPASSDPRSNLLVRRRGLSESGSRRGTPTPSPCGSPPASHS